MFAKYQILMSLMLQLFAERHPLSFTSACVELKNAYFALFRIKPFYYICTIAKTALGKHDTV